MYDNDAKIAKAFALLILEGHKTLIDIFGTETSHEIALAVVNSWKQLLSFVASIRELIEPSHAFDNDIISNSSTHNLNSETSVAFSFGQSLFAQLGDEVSEVSRSIDYIVESGKDIYSLFLKSLQGEWPSQSQTVQLGRFVVSGQVAELLVNTIIICALSVVWMIIHTYRRIRRQQLLPQVQ